MPRNQDCSVSVLQVFHCSMKGAFDKNSIYFPNNVHQMNFKCIFIINTIHSLHLRQPVLSRKAFWVTVTVLASLFLILLLCEISLVELNLCVSKDCTTVLILGHNVLSEVNHRWSWMVKKVRILFVKSNISLATFHTLLFLLITEMTMYQVVDIRLVPNSTVTIWWILSSGKFKQPII
jgi:hypothetical protein